MKNNVLRKMLIGDFIVEVEKFGEPNMDEIIEYAKEYDSLDADELEDMLELGNLKLEYGILTGWDDGDTEFTDQFEDLDKAINRLEEEVYHAIEDKRYFLPQIKIIVNDRAIYESCYGIGVEYKNLEGLRWKNLSEEEQNLLLDTNFEIVYEGDIDDPTDYSLVKFNDYLSIHVSNKSTDDNLVFIDNGNFIIANPKKRRRKDY